MSFNSAAEILDAFRGLQKAADHFEAETTNWDASPDVVERRAELLQEAFAKFAFMASTNP
jgi:hypothetical protein